MRPSTSCTHALRFGRIVASAAQNPCHCSTANAKSVAMATANIVTEAYAISMLNAARKHGEQADKDMGRGSIILPGLRQ